MSSLKEYLYRRVRVVSTDGRLYEGKLEGFDNQTNIVLSGCIELVVKTDQGEFKEIQLGIYMMRGGSVVCIGEVEGEVDWSTVVGSKLKTTKNR